jgi:hypothetical protein
MSGRFLFLLAIVGAVGLAWADLQAAPPDADQAPAEFFAGSVQPFLKKYCFQCHFGPDAEGQIKLDAYSAATSVTHDRPVWRRVLAMIRGRDMPPEDSPQPKPKEVEAIAKWIDARLHSVDCSAPVNPGRVTIRRLNRVEYANTIRDLLGVSFDALANLPADDVGYGFDTIGDVLSLPPILMEKYLDAAEQIATQAIVVDELDALPIQRIEPARMSSTAGGTARGSARPLFSRGEVSAEVRFPKKGKYVLRIGAFAQQAGGEPAKMSLRLDEQELKVFDVEAVRDVPAVYEYGTTVPAGKHRVGAAFLNDYYNPKAEDPSDRDRNLYVRFFEILGPLRRGWQDYPKSHRRIFSAIRDERHPDRRAARRVLRRLVSRAYRRPVGADELNQYLRLFHQARDQGETFHGAVRVTLTALLVSPHFLFKVELDPGPDDRGGVRSLSDYELATRMSYFLWSTMPDSKLFREATAGTIRQNLEPQVRRMLADPKIRALVFNFAGQWLQLRNLETVAPDRRLFPAFDDQLRQAMLTESVMCFETMIREDRSVLELIDADFTFVNERLARHYGIDGVNGDHFQRVSLGGAPRGGVITQAGVLTVTSNPTRTSPVKRGKWIMETILGTPPPEPPPDVPMLDESDEAIQSGSLRERMELHRKKETCAVCHRKMDALGFALENFDAVGAWRTRDGEFPIDASGVLPDGQSFRGPKELKTILRGNSRDDFVRCLTEKMLTYALGRGLEYYDKCAVDRITRRLKNNGYRFSTLVFEIVKSEPFQKRSATRE